MARPLDLRTIGSIYAVGLNYRDPRDPGAPGPERPLIYGKAPSSVAGHGDVLTWDRELTPNVDALPPGATVFDCVYVPRETPLLVAARARGLNAANGEEMLIAQATIAFERWTGVGGMADVMRAAVAPLFADPGVSA